jgi:hypothetical protein
MNLRKENALVVFPNDSISLRGYSSRAKGNSVTSRTRGTNFWLL